MSDECAFCSIGQTSAILGAVRSLAFFFTTRDLGDVARLASAGRAAFQSSASGDFATDLVPTLSIADIVRYGLSKTQIGLQWWQGVFVICSQHFSPAVPLSSECVLSV